MPMQTERPEMLQSFLTNPIDWERVREKKLAAIIGDSPSKYAKSPIVWNAAFEALGMEAVFLAFDVEGKRLEPLLEAIRKNKRFLGLSVTVPHKIAVIPFLDEVDPKAKAIGAVNTIAKTPDGRLIGYNTDGQGGIDSLLNMPVSDGKPFLKTLRNQRVLLMGAGGAARAMAFYLGEAIEKGRLFLANRDARKGEALALEVGRLYQNSEFIPEGDIEKAAKEAVLIVNATTKGQQGIRRLPDGKITCLEPYSCLASAAPPLFSAGDEESFFRKWTPAARKDIEKNNQKSFDLLLEVPATVALFDLIYAPLETVFLRQGRWTGHRTLNGKMMNIGQAADAFCRKVLKDPLAKTGLSPEAAYTKVCHAMQAKW